jgi:hypothetical protein
MDNLMHKINAYVGRTIDFRTGTEVDTLDGEIINWNIAEKPEPTEEQLNAFEDEARILESDNQIINSRKAEYPTIQECVHAILDDDLTALQVKRQAVKDKYPK